MEREVLRLANVTYKEKDEAYLQDFELNIKMGEIMGLLPINSYGLQEFLYLIQNNPTLYYGSVYFMGKEVDSWHDRKRSPNRITVISDANALVFGQNVLTNTFVLRNGFRQRIIHESLLEKQLIPFMEEIGLKISPYTPVEDLSAFERVEVEILRAVIAGHRLIVLQEIGTVIGEDRMGELYSIIRHYSKKGISFLIISAHMEEIRPICLRTALMSNGRILDILEGGQMGDEVVDRLSREYIERVLGYMRSHPVSRDREELLYFKGMGALDDLRIPIYRGEYLVIKPQGNSIYERIKDFVFEQGASERGVFFRKDHEIDVAKNENFAFLTEQPDMNMLFPQMSYADNLLFTIDRRIEHVKNRRGIIKSVKQELSDILKGDVFDKRIQDLSQRERIELIYARVILQRPEIVFCIQPFKGADMSARLLIWELQELLLKKGITVVVIAMNMADTLSLADRVVEIDEDAKTREILRRDFGTFSPDIPWSRWFK